jgi:hypothetical protein
MDGIGLLVMVFGPRSTHQARLEAVGVSQETRHQREVFNPSCHRWKSEASNQKEGREAFPQRIKIAL